jgi:O-antigen/teichoic acid export membrane protein
VRRLTASMSSAARMVSESAHTTAWAITGLAFSLFAGVITARMLGPSDRGTLAVILTVVGLGTLVCAFGTNAAFRVLLPSDSRVTISVYWVLSARLGVVSPLLLLPAIAVMSHRVDSELTRPAVVVCLAVLTVSIFAANQVMDCFNALHQSVQSALWNSLGSLITALLLLGCWLVGLGLKATLLAYAVGFVFRAVSGVAILARSPAALARPSASGGQRMLLRAGLPLLGMVVGQAFVLRADQLFVGLLLGSHAAGLYAVAATPAGILTVLAISVGQVTLAEAAHGGLVHRLLMRQVALAVVATAAACAIGIALLPSVLPFAFGEEFNGAVRVGQWLLAVQIGCAPYLVLSRAAAGYGLVKLSGFSAVVGAVAMVASAVTLVPRFGLIGAPCATAVAFAVMVAVVGAGLLRKRPWRAAWKDATTEPATTQPSYAARSTTSPGEGD